MESERHQAVGGSENRGCGRFVGIPCRGRRIIAEKRPLGGTDVGWGGRNSPRSHGSSSLRGGWQERQVVLGL